MKKLSFQTLRNVLTGLDEGLSYSQITQRTQTSKASVSRIAQAADQTGSQPSSCWRSAIPSLSASSTRQAILLAQSPTGQALTLSSSERT